MLLEDLDFEELEIWKQVMVDAWVTLTERQKDCLFLCVFGELTQAEVGERLGITQRTVSFHFNAALEKVRRIAPGYVYSG